LHGEFSETAYAVRSLNQSYEFKGHSGCGCWTAGSCFIQRPVDESLAELRAFEQKELQVEQKKRDEEKKKEEKKHDMKKKKKPLKPKPDADDESGPVRFELFDPTNSTEA
jgi:hypothetical protein